MAEAKVQKRSKIKPFVKCVNFNHMMPTRYVVDIDLKKVIGDDLKTAEKRHNARSKVKEVFESRYVLVLSPMPLYQCLIIGILAVTSTRTQQSQRRRLVVSPTSSGSFASKSTIPYHHIHTRMRLE
jgi:large subunit ribosomal protein L27e